MVMVRKVEVEASEACNEPTEVVFCYGNGGGGVRPIGVAWWRCRGFGLWVLVIGWNALLSLVRKPHPATSD